VCIVNAGLTFFFWVQGLVPSTEDKFFEGLLFTSLAFIGLVLAMVWVVVDWRMGNLCNSLKPIKPKSLDKPKEDNEAKEQEQ